MRGNIEVIVDKLLRMREPTPQVAIAQQYVSNLQDFAEWMFTLDNTEGIHRLADEIGFGVNDIRAAFSNVVRGYIKEIDPEFQ